MRINLTHGAITCGIATIRLSAFLETTASYLDDGISVKGTLKELCTLLRRSTRWRFDLYVPEDRKSSSLEVAFNLGLGDRFVRLER